jgi:hypothetical protein
MTWRQAATAVMAAGCVLTAARAGGGAPPRPKIDASALPALLDTESTAALAGNLRALLIQALPDPLYEDDRHWGGREWVAHGVTWRGKGLRVRPEFTKTLRNDGRWWKMRVTADDLRDSLVIDLRDFSTPEAGRVTFTTFLALDAHVDYDQENWDDGVRLYAGSVRARLRAKLTLRCEATAKLEPGGSLLPDAVFRLHATAADLHYDNLVVEHAAGVGGELAKLLGDAAVGGVEQWRPSAERRLLEQIDAALVKAADTKEVRVSLMRLLKAR